jgi:IS1 family transposase
VPHCWIGRCGTSTASDWSLTKFGVFIGKKMRHVQEGDDPQLGDVWTFCAIDSETKLVPSYHVSSKRSQEDTNAFIADLASRLNNRVQISTDGMNAYEEAIELALGRDVDYAQIVKTFQSEDGLFFGRYSQERKYSQPRIRTSEKTWLMGKPDSIYFSTSYVERLNASTRTHVRRLTRLTLAFSKKKENFEAATALNFASHSFVKSHRTLKMTPAMAAGVERKFWSYGDLVEAVS